MRATLEWRKHHPHPFQHYQGSTGTSVWASPNRLSPPVKGEVTLGPLIVPSTPLVKRAPPKPSPLAGRVDRLAGPGGGPKRDSVTSRAEYAGSPPPCLATDLASQILLNVPPRKGEGKADHRRCHIQPSPFEARLRLSPQGEGLGSHPPGPPRPPFASRRLDVGRRASPSMTEVGACATCTRSRYCNRSSSGGRSPRCGIS